MKSYGNYNNIVPILNFPLKLNIGAGEQKLNGFTTLDLHNADICWDLTNGIPLPNECCEYIYTSHTLEHFDASDCHLILMEIVRIAMNNCIVEIIVPEGSGWAGHIPCHYRQIELIDLIAWGNWDSRMKLLEQPARRMVGNVSEIFAKYLISK